MAEPLRLLMLEDSAVDARLNEHTLQKAGLIFVSRRVERRDEFLDALETFRPDLVLADYRLPEFDGLEALERLRERDPDLPFVFVSGAMGEDLASEALHRGADDYILKDRIHRLPAAINRAIDAARQRAQLRRAEADLRASEERFRSLVETSSDWIWELDARWRFTYSSPRGPALLGLGGRDLLGQSWLDLIDPADRPRVGAALESARGQGQPFALLPCACPHPDGHPVHLESSGVPILGPEGAVQGYRGISRDISQRRQDALTLELQAARAEALLALPRLAEECEEGAFLQQAMDRLEGLTESLIGFVHFVDAEEECVALTAWSTRTREQYCQASFDAHYPIRQAGVWADSFRQRRAIVCNDYGALGPRHGLPPGHAALERFVSVPVLERERVVMLAGVGNKATDYTDLDVETVQLIANEMWRSVQRQRNEADLRQYGQHLEDLVAERTAALDATNARLREAMGQAQAANAAKSIFLANMSHEIRTPLNAIIGLTHLLMGEPGLDPQRGKLRKIDSAAKHLLSIISDVLDLSKIEAGKLTLAVTDFELGSLLNQVASILSEPAQAKGLALRVERDGEPLWLRGDAIRLRQALLNLAGNAVKFTERGQVVLRGRSLGPAESGLRVRLEVADSGIGIERDRAQALFQPFEQADDSISRRYGGTGLGLSITRGLVDLMGGRLGVDSTPGHGSTFWIEVSLQGARPRAGEPPPRPEVVDPAQSLAGRRPLRVLVAEDNPVNAEVMLELLRRVGIEGTLARNGEEAVRLAGPIPFDLMLMDVRMPVLDGLEATRRIRGLDRHRGTPIIAITASAFEEDRLACLGAGMSDFIAKPVEPETLYRVIETWLPPLTQGAPIQVPAAGAQTDGGPAEGLADRPAEGHSGEIDRLGSLAILKRLEGLLAVDDTAAEELFSAHAAALRLVLGPQTARQLQDEIERFAYPQALERLRQLRIV